MSRIHRLAVNEEGFVFDPATGESFTVNGTGFVILKGLKENKEPEEIAEEITERFDVEPEETERDVSDFIERLRAFKLL
jgi:PqqD family protein of HPr-rel-A system